MIPSRCASNTTGNSTLGKPSANLSLRALGDGASPSLHGHVANLQLHGHVATPSLHGHVASPSLHGHVATPPSDIPQHQLAVIPAPTTFRCPPASGQTALGMARCAACGNGNLTLFERAQCLLRGRQGPMECSAVVGMQCASRGFFILSATRCAEGDSTYETDVQMVATRARGGWRYKVLSTSVDGVGLLVHAGSSYRVYWTDLAALPVWEPASSSPPLVRVTQLAVSTVTLETTLLARDQLGLMHACTACVLHEGPLTAASSPLLSRVSHRVPPALETPPSDLSDLPRCRGAIPGAFVAVESCTTGTSLADGHAACSGEDACIGCMRRSHP